MRNRKTRVRLPALSTLPNKNFNKSFTCNHVFPELTALCPVTKLPDFYVVQLSYAPDRKLVELKSLKLYFVAYRNLQILHEELTNRILEDFVDAVHPLWAKIEVTVNNRGGIDTVITRLWKRRSQKFRLPR